MPVRRAQSLVFRAKGLTDAVDGTNAFPGSMQFLSDLIPNPTTAQQFVPRPASVSLVQLGGFDPLLDSDGNPLLDSNGNIIYAVAGSFTAPDQIEVLFVVGSRIYGMVATGRFSGNSEPFCYDTATGAFVTISNVTAANTPTSEPLTGDWTPPTMSMIANKIIITHSGYDGVTNFIGWIDVSGFSSTTITGNTHTSTLVDNLSSNVLQDGFEVGQLFTASGVPPNTYIVSIAANGLSLVLSNPTTSSLTATTITVTGGTTAAPQYGAGQVVGNFPFPSVPVAVSQFNGRAYYAVGNGTMLSDSLEPLRITGAGGTFVPILTMGDSTPVTALAGVPLANQVIGGIVQSLIAFKGVAEYYQVTGDPATTNLTNNVVDGSVGTNAPNSLASTPQGIAYLAPDGLRFIGVNGQSSNPVGADGNGISVPIEYAINPTRMCGAYNQNVYRFTLQNGFVNGQPYQEYWYDLNLQVFTGPHSFPMALIEAIYTPTNMFISTAVGTNGNIWRSTALPSASSTYVENGNPISPAWQPSLLPDNQAMAANSSPQGTIGLALPDGATVTVLALDELGNVLDTVILTGPGAGGSVWDSFNWGSATWGTPIVPFRQYTLPWHQPLVFKQATLRMTTTAMAGFVIGNAYLQYVELGYVGAAAA